MKCIIKTDTLKNITGTLIKVAAKEGLESAFNGIHIETTDGKVFFRSRQIDFGVLYQVEAENTENGSVCVPAHTLDGVVSTLIDAKTEMQTNDKKMMITTNTSSSDIYILEEGEKPAIETPDEEAALTIRREVLIQGFKNVQHAAAESVVKPEIASVFIYTKNNAVYFVATDAFRLAETRFLVENGTQKDEMSVLVPIKNAVKIIRVLEGVSDTNVSLYTQGGAVCIQTENVLLRTNSVKGSFPDYKNIIPENFDATFTVLKGDITNFLKKARLFADKLNKVSLSMQDSKTLSLKLSNETVGTTENTVPAVVQGNVEALPPFNYKFIHDAVSVIADDRITLSMVNDKTKPMMIRGTEDTSFTAILSPLLDK